MHCRFAIIILVKRSRGTNPVSPAGLANRVVVIEKNKRGMRRSEKGRVIERRLVAIAKMSFMKPIIEMTRYCYTLDRNEVNHQLREPEWYQ